MAAHRKRDDECRRKKVRVERHLMPEPFEAPKNYQLQKSIGCMALHRVLQHLLPVMHKGRRDWTVDQFR